MSLTRTLTGLATLAAITIIGCTEDVVVHDHYYEDHPRVYTRVRVEEPPPAVAVAPPPTEEQPVDAAPQASSQDQEQYDNGTDQATADSTAPPTDDDVQYFESDLQPYGDWVVTADFGRCFRPRGLAVGWRPYSLGHWAYTDDNGWLWVSDEPFGWATYHYGRWATVDGGWAWVPGRTWGPAWVAWRHGGGYAGWAPIPAVRRGGVAVSIGVQIGGLGVNNFLFVDEGHIAEPRVFGYIHPARENVTIINRTTNITNITYVNGRVANHGVDVREVERVSGRRVAHVRVVDSSSRGSARQNGNQVSVFRPTVASHAKTAHEAEAEKIEHNRAVSAHTQHVDSHTPVADPHATHVTHDTHDAHDSHIIHDAQHDEHVDHVDHDAAHDAHDAHVEHVEHADDGKDTGKDAKAQPAPQKSDKAQQAPQKSDPQKSDPKSDKNAKDPKKDKNDQQTQ